MFQNSEYSVIKEKHLGMILQVIRLFRRLQHLQSNLQNSVTLASTGSQRLFILQMNLTKIIVHGIMYLEGKENTEKVLKRI